MASNSEQGPRDWRRRRRGRPQPEFPGRETAPDASPGPDQDGELVLSPTLSSVFEPALDKVGEYGAPMVVAGIVGLVAGITVVAFVGSMSLYGWIDIIIGAGLLALVGAVFFSTVVAAFVSRTGRYGVNTLILLGAFFGIVLVANIISFENTKRIDVTATSQFSLSVRTRDLLKNLDEDIRATAFYKEIGPADDAEFAQRRNTVESTLEELDARSNRFSYRIVDPDLKPEVVSKFFGARPTGFVSEIIVVENLEDGKFDVLRPTDVSYTELEQDLVTGTLVAIGEEQKKIYFLAGHGERNLNSGSPDGYALVRDGLEQDNYDVRSLAWPLSETDVEVPQDAALLIIAGPTSELPESHQEALHRYLEQPNDNGENGNIIFLAEPDSPTSFLQFAARWGIILGRGYIRDVERSLPGLPQTLNLATFNPSPQLIEITSPKGQDLERVFMPGATSIDLLNDGVREPLPLALTSSNSFLIDDPDRTDPITDGENADRRGPFFPAAMVRSAGRVGTQAPASPPADAQLSDIMVFGDSDFLANSGYTRGSGADLFLNSANYMLGDFSLIGLHPKAIAFREFNLDKNEYDFVRFSSWLFLPGIMALAAAFVWWVRR